MPYNVIFFDPPYRHADEIDQGKPLAASLKRLARDTISTPDAILILRTPEHTEAPQLPQWHIHDCWELSSMMVWILVKQPMTDDDEDAQADQDADAEIEEAADAAHDFLPEAD